MKKCETLNTLTLTVGAGSIVIIDDEQYRHVKDFVRLVCEDEGQGSYENSDSAKPLNKKKSR